jgi:hypothetical protein
MSRDNDADLLACFVQGLFRTVVTDHESFLPVSLGGAGDARVAAGRLSGRAIRTGSQLPAVHERGSHWREVALIRLVLDLLLRGECLPL